MTINVIHGDCINELENLGKNTVALTVTSPPYAMQRKKTYGGISEADYPDWFSPIARQLYRVTQEDGSFILNIKENVLNGTRSLYVYKLVERIIEAGWFWIDDYIWVKKNAMPGKWPNRFRDGWEHCFHFSKSLRPRMNQEAVMVPTLDETRRNARQASLNQPERYWSASGSGFSRKRINWAERKMSYPSNVISFAPEIRNRSHPAAYPVGLASWFIKLFSNERDLVLDPFAGSGTTLIACKQLNRRGIGIEINGEYCTAALLRLGRQNEPNFTLNYGSKNFNFPNSYPEQNILVGAS